MKLKKLIIKNFRGLKGDQNEIDFTNSDILFLIGQNNVGKSSFLNAYEFFVKSKQSASKEDFYDYDSSIPIEIEGHFIKETDDDENPLLVGKGKNQEPDWVEKWVDSNSIIRVRKVWDTVDGQFTKQTFDPASGVFVDGGFGGLDQLFQKFSPTPIFISAMETEASLEDKVNKVLQKDFISKIEKEYPEEYKKVVADITDLQEKIIGEAAIGELNQQLNENFQKVFTDLTLKIENKDSEKLKIEDAFKKHHSIIVNRTGCDRKEVFNQHGHGVIRQALFNFISFLEKTGSGSKKVFLILFEEPELYLHPKVAFKLRKSLYDLASDSPYQVLCATHSPMMIDISKPHSSLVRIAKEEDEVTKTFQVETDVFQSTEETKERVQMINRFNPHICESFYADKVLLVEGDTETIVFRELLSNFYPDEEIFVLNTGSKNNIPFFQEILTAFQITHYIIHDGDDRLNKLGNVNSAWTMNERIWEKIESANSVVPNLSRRYVHITNFETANDIKLTGKDKPIKAYKFVTGLKFDDDKPCLNFLKDIVDTQKINHDQEYIETNTQ